MKTFIFTFFLLAGQSFWETKAQPGPECLLNLAKVPVAFVSDLLDTLCLVTGKDITPEDQVAKIKAFADKYKEKLGACDLVKVLGVSDQDVVTVTADSAAIIANNLLQFSNRLGFTNDIIQLLCNPLACVTKILEALNLEDTQNPTLTALTNFKCEEKGSLDAFIKIVTDDGCLPTGTNVAGIPNTVKKILANTLVNNEALQGTVQAITCIVNKALGVGSKVGG